MVAACGLAWSAPVGAVPVATSTPQVVIAAQGVDPVIGQWNYSGGVVQVTGSGTSFVGVVVTPTAFSSCTHPAGQQIWSMTGSNGSYSGTHVGFWLDDCSDNPMATTFTVTAGADGHYELTFCNEVGCVTLTRHEAVATDTSPPQVSIESLSGIVRLGREAKVRYAVADDSGEASLVATLYSNGTEVFTESTDGAVTADGRWLRGSFGPIEGYPGPFYMCIGAQDAAGNQSVNYPQSACAWMSIQVRLAPSGVANGCGGGQWGETAGNLQNWLLDTKEYGGEIVNFRPACNQHDAGYAGITTYDPFLKKVVDFRGWSRLQVDNKFYDDLRTLCHRYLDGTGVDHLDMFRCTRGLSLDDVLLTELAGQSPGALAYWEGVRAYGLEAYDSNSTLPGTQTDFRPETWPPGGGRDNR